jgi:hypothetical protein
MALHDMVWGEDRESRCYDVCIIAFGSRDGTWILVHSGMGCMRACERASEGIREADPI